MTLAQVPSLDSPQSGASADLTAMGQALELARRPRNLVLPNPFVGSVIRHRDKIVGEGFHRGPGLPHAEVEAIEDAKRRGFSDWTQAEIFVSLEPCSHTAKRTPPCAPLLRDLGFKKIHIAHLDPNPQVCGAGVRLLEQSGLKVEVGLLAKESQDLNQAFIKNQSQKACYISLKLAMSWDGRMADDFGKSKWITNEGCREDVHLHRAWSDAIAVGAETFDQDNPTLNVRIDGQTFPRKVVLFGKSKRDWARSKAAKANGRESLIQIDRTQPLRKLPQRLYQEFGLCRLFIEAGPRLAQSLADSGIVDEFILYLSNSWAGGLGKISLANSKAAQASRLKSWIKFDQVQTQMFENDIRLKGWAHVYRNH